MTESVQAPAATDPAAFRAQFPVLERVAYLNAGTTGPVPRRAMEAVQRRIELETLGGRCGRTYFEASMGLAGQLRARYAELLHCRPEELALTGSTTDGVNTVVSGLRFQAGDEIVTSDEEHPGLLAPLGRLARRDGVKVRVAPFEEIANAVSPSTRLIACSHVSWVSGRIVDTASLAETGVPYLLDAAQGIGAVPVDVHALGCDFYAASGQKWLCGPEGSGCLYVRAERLEDLLAPWPGYASVADATRALEFEPAEGARRLDLGFPSGLRNGWALASLEVLGEAGWEWVHERAASLAEGLALRLTERGMAVIARGRSTLVSFAPGEQDPTAVVERLSGEGIVIRNIPTHGLLRVSVGAWSSEEELERLVEALVR